LELFPDLFLYDFFAESLKFVTLPNFVKYSIISSFGIDLSIPPKNTLAQKSFLGLFGSSIPFFFLFFFLFIDFYFFES